MKYILIPVIGLGLALSLVLRVEYKCGGPDVFPTYYGSPFVFREKSLGSSMTYYYSASGLLLNVGVWSILLTALRYGFLKLMEATDYKKGFRIAQHLVVGMLLLLSMVSISFAYITFGRHYGKHFNYWHWDVDQKAKASGVKCEGKWKFL